MYLIMICIIVSALAIKYKRLGFYFLAFICLVGGIIAFLKMDTKAVYKTAENARIYSVPDWINRFGNMSKNDSKLVLEDIVVKVPDDIVYALLDNCMTDTGTRLITDSDIYACQIVTYVKFSDEYDGFVADLDKTYTFEMNFHYETMNDDIVLFYNKILELSGLSEKLGGFKFEKKSSS